VRFIQAAGIFDNTRDGAKRIIHEVGYAWPWSQNNLAATQWTEWWRESKAALGQTASEMFLWYLIEALTK
jgi:hypothetical protein